MTYGGKTVWLQCYRGWRLKISKGQNIAWLENEYERPYIYHPFHLHPSSIIALKLRNQIFEHLKEWVDAHISPAITLLRFSRKDLTQ